MKSNDKEKSLEEINKEIEEYLLKQQENDELLSVKKKVTVEEKAFSLPTLLFSSMSVILIIIALIRLGNILLIWIQQIFF